MAQIDSHTTTDLSAAPTLEEMDAMWLARREAEQAEADRAAYERCRRYSSIFGEAA